MNVVVFAGPTVDAAVVQSFFPAVVRGPVSFGDVTRALDLDPIAIVIVDGYFDRVPAVWHKEILWAMSQGVHVFGGSSMGALRAAELADLGMVGVGAIFEAYRGGELEDDDEVAVAHGPAETGYRPVSEAMVNIRATIRRAVAEGVVGAEAGDALVRLAKRRFYADRTLAALRADARDAGLDPEQVAALAAWWTDGRVDLKRSDALALLAHVASWLQGRPERKRVSFRFNATDAWLEATRRASQIGPSGPWAAGSLPGPAAAPALLSIVEELKIDGSFRAVWRDAALRGVALRAAGEAGIRPDPAAVRAAADTLRRNLGLEQMESFRRWQAEQGLSDAGAVALLEEHARVAWAEPVVDDLAARHLTSELQSQGRLGELQQRATAKQAALAQAGTKTPSLRDLSLEEPELWRWYFRERLGAAVPDDRGDYARRAGFRNEDELRSAVLRERLLADANGDCHFDRGQSTLARQDQEQDQEEERWSWRASRRRDPTAEPSSRSKSETPEPSCSDALPTPER